MTFIIKAVQGESVSRARQEIERIEAGAEQSRAVTRATALSLKVDGGARRATESVVDDPNLNWEGMSIYMEAADPVLSNLPE